MTCRRSWTARAAMWPLAIALGWASTGCSPALNWREFVPEGSGLSMTFPCRPDRYAREVTLAGAPVRMEMLVCSAADQTFAVSFFELGDPTRVSPALAEWRSVTVANVNGTAGPPSPAQIGGMTPNGNAVVIAVGGKLPDGAEVQERAVFFVHGLRLYSAASIGAKLDPAAAKVFFDGLKFPG